MPRFIALLRGINVGGKTMIAMAELRGLFEAEGFTDVKTLLQSGNVLFTAKTGKTAALEQSLEKAVQKKFSRAVDLFIRDAAAWKKIVAGNPFPDEAKNDPGHLVVLCLKDKPKKESLAALKAAIVGRETIHAGDACLYIYYPHGIGNSKLTNALIDRKLSLSGTARNWNTVQKIAALLMEGQTPS